MNRIDEQHRQVLIETYYRGRPFAEVATELEIQEGAVKSRVYDGLRANDSTCNWRLEVPVRLYYTPSDEAVSPLDTRHRAAQLRSRGGSVEALGVGRIAHLESVAVAAPRMLRWLSDAVTPGSVQPPR